MELKLLNDSIIASLDDNGLWIYKANSDNKLKPFKKNGTLKAQYKDLPRFKIISEYEKKELDDYEKLLQESVRDISIKLSVFSNKH